MSLDMSSGCLRGYQKGLHPGGTTGLFVQRLGQDPACFFFLEMFQLKSLACTLGWGKGGSVALLSAFIQVKCLVQGSLWESPHFSPGSSFNLVSGFYVSLGFSGKAILCGSLLLGDSGLRVALSWGLNAAHSFLTVV